MNINKLSVKEIQQKYNCDKSMAKKIKSIYLKPHTKKSDVYSIYNKNKIVSLKEEITPDKNSTQIFDELLDIYGDELKNTK